MSQLFALLATSICVKKILNMLQKPYGIQLPVLAYPFVIVQRLINCCLCLIFFKILFKLVHSLSLTSVASFLLILQSTCPFRFLSVAFNISRAPCLDIFSSLRNCFRFCSSFNSYFLPLSEKNSFARSWSCFWLHFPWPSVGLPPSFLVC